MDSKSWNAYVKSLKVLKRCFNESPNLRESFNKKSIGIIVTAGKTLENGLDQLGKDEKVVATPKQIKAVAEALNLLLAVISEKPLTPLVKDIGLHFSLLAINWNNATAKNVNIRFLANLINRLTKTALLFDDYLILLRRLLPRLERIAKLESPAIGVARHWFKSLEKEVEPQSDSIATDETGETAGGQERPKGGDEDEKSRDTC